MDRLGLDKPANRTRFLRQVARGVPHDDAAREIGVNVRTVQRFSGANAAFGKRFKEAKRKGRKRRHAAKLADAADEREREGLAELEKEAAEGAPQAYLEEMELAEPDGLQLNPHLPPLSVRSFLGMCQAFAYDKKEHPTIRRKAMELLGAHTFFPALRPPPPRNETGTVAEAQPPALAIPGSGPRVVVLVAPDNGMYAPGCGPGQATVVDEAEAAEAELVTAG